MNELFSHFDAVFDSPLGGIGIRVNNSKLNSVDFIDDEKYVSFFRSPESRNISNNILEYFKNPKQKFAFQLNLKGTDFQQRVWLQLLTIPLGQTKTYGEIAATLGTSARAVGNACRRNPIPIVIPCHRVVARNGLGGFAGSTTGTKIKIKQWLLNFENQS